jgi:hypothetical protein
MIVTHSLRYEYATETETAHTLDVDALFSAPLVAHLCRVHSGARNNLGPRVHEFLCQVRYAGQEGRVDHFQRFF